MNLFEQPAHVLHDMLVNKEITSLELTQAVLDRIDQVEGDVQAYLAEKGVKFYKTFVGNYMTALEMAGCSLTLLKLDDELKELLDAPSEAPGFRV